MKTIPKLSILLPFALLAACGGGGGGTTPAATGPTTAITSTSIAGSLGNVDPTTLASFGVDAGGNDGGIGSGDSGADGSAGEGGPINNGTVIITDASSTPKTLRVKTNAEGYYFAKVTGFTAPLVVKIVSQSGKIYYSLREDAIAPGSVATINITPLTDKVASLVAGTASVSVLTPADITTAKVASAKASVVATFSSALTAAGVTNTTAFDPIKTPFKPDGTGYDKVLDQVRHETNASGATDLYPKTVAYAADGTVASTPLSPSAPLALVVGGKELNFARLDSLRKQLNACFAQAEAARSYTTVGNACAGLAHPNFKSAGRDFVETVVQMSGRKDRNRVLEAADVMTGAQFDAPELLLLESSVSAASATSATVADLDNAIIELRWYQPANASYRSTAFLMRRFDNFNAAAAPAVQRSAIANADGTSSDWWFYGGQSSYQLNVRPRLNRYTNLNPATNTVLTGVDPSSDVSSVGIFVGTQKFNTATRAWEDSGIASARVTGPGLPVAGFILSRISGATATGACVGPTDVAYNANNAPVSSGATYMGFYSSTGIVPGASVTSTTVVTIPPSGQAWIPPGGPAGELLPIGATRTFIDPRSLPTFVGNGPRATTAIVDVVPFPGTVTVASFTILLPPAPGTVTAPSFSILQTAATVNRIGFGFSLKNDGYTFTNVTTQTNPLFTGNTGNGYNFGRSDANTGANIAYNPSTSIYGANVATTPPDFSQISAFSKYKFEFFNTAGVLIGTDFDRLLVGARPPQALKSLPLHDLSPSHTDLLIPAKAAVATATAQWLNNLAAPTPNLSYVYSFVFDTPNPTEKRNAAQLLKRRQLSTDGPASTNFALNDLSTFTGCQLPVGNTALLSRLDTQATRNTSNSITNITYREIGIQTNINRIRVQQTTGWSNNSITPPVTTPSAPPPVTAPAPVPAPAPAPTGGYAKATLSGVFANCPVTSGATKEWWTCMSGLEFAGLTTFGGQVCSMRIRTDGAFEFTNNGVTKITNKPIDLYAAGSYYHQIFPGGHALKANILTTNSPVLTDPPLFVIEVELNQLAPNPTYQVTYGGDICKLTIQ